MLQHPIVGRGCSCRFKKFFDALNARYPHRLSYLHRVGAPGRNHFFAWANEFSRNGFVAEGIGTAKEPNQFFKINGR